MLGRPVSSTDQPPGTYRYRHGKGCPWQPLRIVFEDKQWFVMLRGEVIGSGDDPNDIPIIRLRGPFHPIGGGEYAILLEAYRVARPGSPLLTPNEPVNLRNAPALHRKDDDG